ncbi:MAG: hypothetical protein CLLPBCKN_005427 [Chroococcidiopsis cubana SAG 39.79]|nr:hypothetical protein [Chroococcidiopsis cubana SAG 39.79]
MFGKASDAESDVFQTTLLATAHPIRICLKQ